jgi:phospholipase/lecithinase/hemolysin
MKTNTRNHTRRAGVILSLLSGFASVQAAVAKDRTIATVFGDSGVEQGNLYALPGMARPDAPYYSKDGFSRESNGPVWVEYLVPDITPLLAADTATSHINYAFSGATSGSDNIATPVPSGLIAQVDAYAARRAGGAAAPGARDVFILAAGTNDFLRDIGQRDLSVTSSEVVGNVTASVKRHSALGAQTLIVEDVANFLAAPAFNNIVPASDRPALEKAVSSLLDSHRANQRTALRQALADTPAGVQIAVLPLQKLFAHVIANANALGFKVADRACYDETTGTLCSTDIAVQNSYLFFDSLHLTTSAQRIQALYYRALISQLDGGANMVPGRIISDTRHLNDVLATVDRQVRDRNWLATQATGGFEMIADGSVGTNRDTFRFGVGYGNGHGWTGRIMAARITGSSHFDGGGGHAQSAWGASISTENRFGRLRVSASIGGLWGRTRDGVRLIDVPLMQTHYGTRMSSYFADLSAGWVWTPGNWQIVPSVLLHTDQVHISGYRETGETGLEMGFQPITDTAYRAGAALIISHRSWTISKIAVQPRLTIDYQRRLNTSFRAITGDLLDNVSRPITAVVRTSAVNRPGISSSLLIGSGDRVQIELSGRQTIGLGDHALAARLIVHF